MKCHFKQYHGMLSTVHNCEMIQMFFILEVNDTFFLSNLHEICLSNVSGQIVQVKLKHAF